VNRNRQPTGIAFSRSNRSSAIFFSVPAMIQFVLFPVSQFWLTVSRADPNDPPLCCRFIPFSRFEGNYYFLAVIDQSMLIHPVRVSWRPNTPDHYCRQGMMKFNLWKLDDSVPLVVCGMSLASKSSI
jgi:hypothetical protein